MSVKGAVYRRESHGPAKRDHFRLSAVNRLYILVATIESVLVVGLVLSAFIILDARAGIETPHLRGTALYMSTFILGSIFSVIYAYDALRAHNVVQLILHLVLELCLLAWACVEIYQVRIAVDGLDRAGPCVFRSGAWDCHGPGSMNNLMFKVMVCVPPIIFVSMLVFILLSRKVYQEFGWEVYRLVNASPQMKRIHRQYQTFQSLIKLLFFFASAFCMMYIIIIPLMWRRRAEVIITIIALPLFYPTLVMLMWAVRREHRVLMALGLVILVPGEAYFIFKMATLFLPGWTKTYSTCRITLAVFSGFAIVLNAATFIYGLVCLLNFGEGLRPCHDDAANKNQWWKSQKYKDEHQTELELDSHSPFLVDK